MRTVAVPAGKAYEVRIGRGLIPRAGREIARVHAPCRVCVVTDSRVAALYADSLEGALREAGFESRLFVFPEGEASKTLRTFGEAEAFLFASGLTRSDMVVTLGGGVAGDLGGFAAACYQRGIPFVQVPTSLLCAVDASVGGKTAVDLPGGKNMVGAFHQPVLVLCDTAAFSTLDEKRWADGAAESVKHGLIADAGLFGRMSSPLWREDIDGTVEMNLEVKKSFVCGDERDMGKRQLLNFGHTIGHAVESLSGFALSHGQAVAIGMAAEIRAARRMGPSPVDEKDVIPVLASCGLPTECPYEWADVARAAMGDKKRAGNAIALGVLTRVGEARLEKTDLEAFREFVRLGVE